MRQYVRRRLALAVPTLVLVSVIVFSIMRLMPGDVVIRMVEGHAYAPTVDALRKELGLDRPAHTQYLEWIGGIVLRGDFGSSYWTRQPIWDEFIRRFPITLELAGLTILTSVVIGVLVGIVSAVRQDTASDYVGRILAILALSVPYFGLAVLVVVLPSIYFKWTPIWTYVPFTTHPLENLKIMIVPALVFGVTRAGPIMRIMRSALLDVLRQDYIRTAWSKGLPERAIVLRHALKNALIPVVSLSGLQTPLSVAIRRLPRTLPWYAEVWAAMLRRKPLGTIGGAIVLVMLAAAVFAGVLTPYGFAETNLRERFVMTSGIHRLGTDQIGRDEATRILYGARISLYVGFGAVALGSTLATALGIFSAYWGGRVDLFLQRAVDAWMAFPPLLILMSIMSLLTPGVLNITLVLGVNFGIQNSRIVRGMALSIRENTYIESARAMGSGHARVTLVHILPNVLPTIIVVATTGLSTVILREASLSFLGLGGTPRPRSEPLVSRPRRAAALPDVGRDALAGRARPHVPGAMARDLARGPALARGLRLQHARRRAPRPARSPPEGRLTRS